MTARRDSSDGPEVGSLGGRALLIGAVVFAAAATGLLVLTDEQKWLRLGIVAALWAALTGAFVAARYRRQLTDQRDVAAERQEIYELELEREVAARREYELEVAAAAKRQAEEKSRDDIDALRGELQNLRQTLEGLLGGEFLVERYALQSTRMRSLGDERPLVAPRRDVKHLPAAVPGETVVRDPQTEMMERLQKPQLRPDSRPPSAPRRPERPTPEQVKPPAAARQEQRPHPAELSDRWFVSDGIAETPPSPQRSEQPRRPEPQRPADPPPSRRPVPSNWDDGEPEWGPSWETPGHRAPAAAAHGGGSDQTSWLAQYNQANSQERTYGTRAYVPQSRPEQGSRSAMPAARPEMGSQSRMPAVSRQDMPSQPRMPAVPRTDMPSQSRMPAVPRGDMPSQSRMPAVPRADLPSQSRMPAVSRPAMPPASRADVPSRPAMPPASRPAMPPVPAPPNGEQASGRRRRAETAEEPGGGRRHRADGQPSWQETVGRAEESTGSHASGRSVSELLANNGHDTSPRRRRRRED